MYFIRVQSVVVSCFTSPCLEARVVIATDGDSDSVSLANHNININKDANPHRNTSSVLTGHQLYWGNQKHIENVKSLISPVGPYDGVDYIIMSDVRI